MEYQEFIENKSIVHHEYGFDVDLSDLNKNLFEFQKPIVQMSLKKGKYAEFAGCGLGKTIMQLAWSEQIRDKKDMNVLIACPLAVTKQTVREGERFGIEVNSVRDQSQVKPGINIINYDSLHKIDTDFFPAIALDESSCIKHAGSKTRNVIIEAFQNKPFVLPCTATPSPNDWPELGNHAELLTPITKKQMEAIYFTHDSGDTSKWRLRKWSQKDFWKWVCTWSVTLRKPSDIGFDDAGYDLPELKYHYHTIKAGKVKGQMFPVLASTLRERQQVRRETIEERCHMAADLINSSNDIHLVFCELNAESELLSKLINDSVEVAGKHNIEYKENAIWDFQSNQTKCLVTKPSMASFGLNLQNCFNINFVGLSDKYEQFYQGIRRCWRFGQTNEVNVNIFIHEKEGNVLSNIQEKDKRTTEMQDFLVKEMSDFNEILKEKKELEKWQNMTMPLFL